MQLLLRQAMSICIFILLTGHFRVHKKTKKKCDIISAAKQGHAGCVQQIIAEGGELEITDPVWDVYGPVSIAASNGNIRIVRMLLAAGMDVNGVISGKGQRACPLTEACRAGNIKTMRTLIELGASPNPNPKANICEPPLHVAVDKDHLNAVKILVKSGASINLSFPGFIDQGGTALCIAAHNGHDKILEYLISVRTDLNMLGTEGTTALMEAARSPYYRAEQCAQLLIRAGAEINKKSTHGQSALSFAVSNEDQVVMEMLLVANAQVVDEYARCAAEDCIGCKKRFPPDFTKGFDYHKKADVSCINVAYAAGMEVPLFLIDEIKDVVSFYNGYEETVESVLKDHETLLPLSELCRKKIRQHLLDLIRAHADFKNLFVAIPRLPLPDIMKDFLLFNIKPQSPWDSLLV